MPSAFPFLAGDAISVGPGPDGPGLGQRRRTEIACKTPIAARFMTIDDPPDETKGSGIPVMGAIPMVIPTLMKI